MEKHQDLMVFQQKHWEKEETPAEWKEGYLIKIPKKGDLSRCDNFRGITLLSVTQAPEKVLNRIILERIKGEVDKTLREEQAGFRQDRSCTDQIATLRIIVEQSIERRGSVMVSTFACHAADPGSIPGPGMCHY